MVEARVIIRNKNGLHLRPAGVFCNTASRYKSKITFSYKVDKWANAKSVLSVLGAGIKYGDELHICCEGFDEEDALDALIEAVESGLGEPV